jgi:hypothetical protein
VAFAAVMLSCGPAKPVPTVRSEPTQSPSSAATPTPAGSPSTTATPIPAPTASPISQPDTVLVTGTLPPTCMGPEPAPTSSAAGPVIAIMSGQDLKLVDTSGEVLNTLTGVPSSSGLTVIGTAPDGVYLWNRPTGALEELGFSGPPRTSEPPAWARSQT